MAIQISEAYWNETEWRIVPKILFQLAARPGRQKSSCSRYVPQDSLGSRSKGRDCHVAPRRPTGESELGQGESAGEAFCRTLCGRTNSKKNLAAGLFCGSC